MNAKFLCVLVCLGVCFTQVTKAYPSYDEKNVDGIIDDIIKKAEELLAKLEQFVKDKIAEAEKLIDEVKEKVKAVVDKVIDGFKTAINKVLDEAQVALKEIEDEAAKLGLNITDCVDASENGFSDLYKKFVANEEACVQTEVQKVEDVINLVKDSIQKAVDLIDTLHNDLDKCVQSQSLSCLKDFIEDAVINSKDIAADIVKEIVDIIQVINGFEGPVEQCAKDGLKQAETDAKQIASDAVQCITNKM